MYTTGILYRRGRRGISTVLGTIIFVGIMFTAVIPMLLVMKQADTLQEMRKYELEILDYERSSEDIYIYVYPIEGLIIPKLKVTAQNKGEQATSIVRLWINDDPTLLNIALQPMSTEQDLGTYTLSPADCESFFIIIITDSGKIVGFDTPMTWVDEYSGWTTGEVFSVNVLINSLPGNEFKIDVWGPDSFHAYGQTEKFDPKFFLVPAAGDYTVEISRGTNLLFTKDLTILWPFGPPVVWVFA